MHYESVGVADMDADGRADLLAAGAGGSFGVLRGNGNGTFGKPQFWHSSRGWDIANAAAAPPLQQTVSKATTTLVVPSPLSTACGLEVTVQTLLHAPQAGGMPGPIPAFTFREGATPLQVRPAPGVQWFT